MNIYQMRLLSIAASEGLNRYTLDELAHRLGLNSRQAVRHHLSKLENDGLIDRLSRGSGSTSNAVPTVMLPVLGAASCGKATQVAEEDIKNYIRVSAAFVGHASPSLFAIIAVGDSMNIARVPCRSGETQSISHGDIAIIDSSVKNPNNGDYVLSVIDGLANIKRFYKDKDKITLVSESSSYHPDVIIHPSDLNSYLVNGKVINVIKNPRSREDKDNGEIPN